MDSARGTSGNDGATIRMKKQIRQFSRYTDQVL